MIKECIRYTERRVQVSLVAPSLFSRLMLAKLAVTFVAAGLMPDVDQ